MPTNEYEFITETGQTHKVTAPVDPNDDNFAWHIANILRGKLSNSDLSALTLGTGLISNGIAIINGVRQGRLQKQQLKLIEENLKNLNRR